MRETFTTRSGSNFRGRHRLAARRRTPDRKTSVLWQLRTSTRPCDRRNAGANGQQRRWLGTLERLCAADPIVPAIHSLHALYACCPVARSANSASGPCTCRSATQPSTVAGPLRAAWLRPKQTNLVPGKGQFLAFQPSASAIVVRPLFFWIPQPTPTSSQRNTSGRAGWKTAGPRLLRCGRDRSCPLNH